MATLRARASAAAGSAPPPTQTAAPGGTDANCELRPCGMLVQTRTDSDQNRPPPPPPIRVRVKYGSVYHEIIISSEATFGELKKRLTGPTGLHHEDQKLFYKDKERDSKEFLDTCGVKNKSKIVLVKDSVGQEIRLFQMKRAAKLEKAAKAISDVSLEVDKLAAQVGALESVISKGGKVTDTYVVNLIELLMSQLVKMEAILEGVDANLKTQGNIQVKRIQSCVETLDILKIKNSKLSAGNKSTSAMQDKASSSSSSSKKQLEIKPSKAPVGAGPAVVITTQWETFDSLFPVDSPTNPSPSTASTTTSAGRGSTQPSFPWDLL